MCLSSYSFQRLGGLQLGRQGLCDIPVRRSRPGEDGYLPASSFLNSDRVAAVS
jgi:hypothetical protein